MIQENNMDFNITHMLLIIANIAHLRHLNKSFSLSEHQLLETTYSVTREYADKLGELLITYDLFDATPSTALNNAFDELRKTNLMKEDNLSFIHAYLSFIRTLRQEHDINLWHSSIDDFEALLNSVYYLLMIECRNRPALNIHLNAVSTQQQQPKVNSTKKLKALDLGKIQDNIYKVIDKNKQFFDDYIDEGWDMDTESFKFTFLGITKPNFNKILKEFLLLERYEFYLEPSYKNKNGSVYIIRK